MERVSLKEIRAKGLMSRISVLRENTNGFPYITFISKDGRVNNVYLGKRSAEAILAEAAIGQPISAFLSNASIVGYEQELDNGGVQSRFKLSVSNNAEIESDYEPDSVLDELFGVEPTSEKFFVDFSKEFTKIEQKKGQTA